MQYVLELGDCTNDNAARVGGKAVGLGSLLQEGLPVPPGFAITTDAYRRSLQATGLLDQIAQLVQDPDQGVRVHV